jgi:hypothetical protein
MRRNAAALAVLLALPAAPVAAHPGHHHPAPRPVLAASNFVIAYGSASVDFTLPKAAELVETAPTASATPGWAVLTSGGWAAVALISRTHRVGDRPLNAVQVHTPLPDHCPPPVAPTAQPVPQCGARVEHAFVSTPNAARKVGGTNRYAFPAGTYQLVVSAPARTMVAVTFRFAGLRGQLGIFATKPVTAGFTRDRVDSLALAHANGAWTRRLTARGFGVLGIWYTTAGDEPGEFTYAECLTAGAAGPANPDDCTPAALTGPPGAVPKDVSRKPVFYAGSHGGFSLTNSGTGTFQTPPLAAGTYTNTYRVTRGGRGPAVGAFAWWVQADGYR